MIVELKGNFLGTHSVVSKSNGNTYYTADVYCEDGDTVRVSVPATLVESLNGVKKSSLSVACSVSPALAKRLLPHRALSPL